MTTQVKSRPLARFGVAAAMVLAILTSAGVTPAPAGASPLPGGATEAQSTPRRGIVAPEAGYRMVSSGGEVYSLGQGLSYGSVVASSLRAPVVGMAPTPSGEGYWVAAANGQVFAFGDAALHGSLLGVHLTRPIVGMAATPSGNGYWLVASDGGIFSFGDARFYGSTGAVHLVKPIIGMSATRSGRGYWLVASDGGVFSFGDARFYGSAGRVHLPAPIAAMATTVSGAGYWMVGFSGHVYPYGDATYYGSVSARTRIAGIAVNPGEPAALATTSEFDSPSGLAVAGSHLWVTNQSGNSVTVVDPASGSWLGTFGRGGYGFKQPDAITSWGTDVFVADAGGAVSEFLASDGLPLRIMSGPSYRLDDPVAITVTKGIVLVLSAGEPSGAHPKPGSITEISAATGAVLRTISGSSFAFDDPVAMAVNGPDVFVADRGNNSVTEVAIATGSLVGVTTGGTLDQPDGVTVSAGNIWVSDGATDAVTEIDPAGKIVGALTDSTGNYGLWLPSAEVAASGNFYVATPFGTSPMVTKVLASSPGAPPAWFMCNTNGPYYFSDLSALAVNGDDVWVASRTGANSPTPGARNGSLTEILATTGALVGTFPSP
jgi:hypothetical protein